MLIVTNGNKTEAIIESNYEKHEELNGDAMQISFSSFSFAQNVGHDLLDYEVTVTDEDGHEYVVKQYQQTGTEKIVTATHIFYELNNIYKYDIYGGTRTFNEFITFLLNGTGWKFENVDITGSVIIANFGEANIITLLQVLRNSFKCEFKILHNKVIRLNSILQFISHNFSTNRFRKFVFKHNDTWIFIRGCYSFNMILNVFSKCI